MVTTLVNEHQRVSDVSMRQNSGDEFRLIGCFSGFAAVVVMELLLRINSMQEYSKRASNRKRHAITNQTKPSQQEWDFTDVHASKGICALIEYTSVLVFWFLFWWFTIWYCYSLPWLKYTYTQRIVCFNLGFVGVSLLMHKIIKQTASHHQPTSTFWESALCRSLPNWIFVCGNTSILCKFSSSSFSSTSSTAMFWHCMTVSSYNWYVYVAFVAAVAFLSRVEDKFSNQRYYGKNRIR